MFEVARTFYDPADNQSGFAEPGAGAQTVGDQSYASFWYPVTEQENPERPTKGIFSWLFPANPASEQRGFAEPQNALEHRPPGSMPNEPPIFGNVYQNYTPYYSRGAAAYVPNFGYVLTNPIGAGVVALQRPQAFYGPAAEYQDGSIWWTSQAVPTAVHLQGLTNPHELAALLSQMEVQAVVRVAA